MDFLKAEQIGSAKWRVLSIPFGGPINGKDSDKEFFSPNTNIRPHWFDRRPAVWHHNLDRSMKADSEIGHDDDLGLEDDGWWSTVWLDRQHRYFAQIDKLLRDGKIYGSSGTLPQFAKTDPDTGEILDWPFVEQTFTPIPANIFSTVWAAKAALFLPDHDSPSADLPSDLPSGGDVEARLRLAGDLARLAERLKTI